MGEATIEFDRDGDGVLSIEESQEAYAVYQQRREIDQFVSQYDSDGNGSMGNADYSAFLSAYEQGNSHADVNRDGVVNSQDLAAYTDMVTRSRNRP
jgi:Ca2+-binding EF-hand superfamily protein